MGEETSAPPTPRAVVIQAIWNFITGEPATVNARADAILAALSAAGFAVVPREPTREMIDAGVNAMAALGYIAANEHEVIAIYRAMLAIAEGETR